MKKIKITIIGAYPYNGNRGVGALTYSTLYVLNEIAKTSNANFDITVINPEFKNIHDQLKIDNTIIKFTNSTPISFFSIKSIALILLSSKTRNSLKRLIKTDFILNIGGGDSFSDIYGVKRFNLFNNQNKLASILKKKYILLPQTIGPFYDERVKKIANKSIEKAALVFARDTQSYSYVKKNTVQQNIFEVVDLAFFMPYSKQKFSENETHVGINVSALLWHGGYTKNNQFGLKANYRLLIHEVIKYFLTIDNVKIHIVPHVVSINSSIENDYEISYQLVNEFNDTKLILAPLFLDPIIAKNYIAGLDFFTGARMHATIAAFSAGVPVFPLAYSRKFNGLFVDTLKYKHLGDMVNQETSFVLKQIEQAFNQKHILAKEIKHILNTTVLAAEKETKEVLTKAILERNEKQQ